VSLDPIAATCNPRVSSPGQSRTSCITSEYMAPKFTTSIAFARTGRLATFEPVPDKWWGRIERPVIRMQIPRMVLHNDLYAVRSLDRIHQFRPALRLWIGLRRARMHRKDVEVPHRSGDFIARYRPRPSIEAAPLDGGGIVLGAVMLPC
jgi:hypothetical protein